MVLAQFLIYSIFFLFFQSISIYGGDAGDLVTAAYTGGIAHPPGYPLYVMLGHVLTFIPIHTIAWRVALLSSIPAALTLAVVAIFVQDLTKSQRAPWLVCAVLANLYLFWLYAIVPEVFMLFLLISIVLLYGAYQYLKAGNIQWLYVMCLMFFLGLTHHQLIVGWIPAIMYVLFQKRHTLLQISPKHIAGLIVTAFIGLLPFLWIPYAAHQTPPIIWSDPVTWHNFLRLVMRSDYGSFQSGTSYGHSIQSRLIQFSFLWESYTSDFTYLGILLLAIGWIKLRLRQRDVFWFLFLAWFVTGPLFFFYASYLYMSRFEIATAERFLLPSYLVSILVLGYGMKSLAVGARKTYIFTLNNLGDSHARTLSKYIVPLVYAFLIILPLSLFYIQYPKLSILKNDTSAEKLGIDFLNSVEPKSILLLRGDLAVFNTEYIYYTQHLRSDVIPLHVNPLIEGKLDRVVHKHYPSIRLPQKANSQNFLAEFIRLNSNRPIYTTVPLEGIPSDSTWVSYGLVYRLYKKSDVPTPAEVVKGHETLWKRYQHPLDGSLGKYQNLMQSNILDYYRNAHIRTGLYLAGYGKDIKSAQKHFQDALELDPAYAPTYHLIARTYMSTGDCKEALKIIQEAQYIEYRNAEMLYNSSMHALYTDCYKDLKKAAIWEERLKKHDASDTINLQEL